MSIKSFLIGQPIETEKEKHERLSKITGLAIFSSDALSSVAYATEEILLALVVAGAALLNYQMGIAAAIAALIVIVSTSYFQTRSMPTRLAAAPISSPRITWVQTRG